MSSSLHIAYLCNAYPHVTHTFIRRELLGVERSGIRIERMTVRRSPSTLPAEADAQEALHTFSILDCGKWQILRDVLAVSLGRPLRFLSLLAWSCRLGSRSTTGVLKHLAYALEACVVSRHAARTGFTHVHSHFGTNATTLAMFASALGDLTYSFTIHGSEEWDSPRFLHIPEKVDKAALVIVISDFARSQTYRWTAPAQWSKVHVIRCGVDSAFLKATPNPVPDTPQFVMVGRIDAGKGCRILLEALGQLRNRKRTCRVVLVGDGPDRAAIEQAAASRGLEDMIRVLGWQDDVTVRRLLDESRALVLPSFAEGLPVVIMEAFAMGRPVIATRVGGIAELVTPGLNGWLVDAGSVEGLAEALDQCLAVPPVQLTTMGLHGRDAVRAKHDADLEASKLAALFATIGHNR